MLTAVPLIILPEYLNPLLNLTVIFPVALVSFTRTEILPLIPVSFVNNVKLTGKRLTVKLKTAR